MKLLTRLLRLRPATTDPSVAPPPAAPGKRLVARTELSNEEAIALSERRGAALRAMFPLMFSKTARRSDLWQAIVVERYLADAANVADLEQRIREVEQRRRFSWSE